MCTGLGIPEEAIETSIGVFSAISIIRIDLMNRLKSFPTLINKDNEEYASIKAKLESEY